MDSIHALAKVYDSLSKGASTLNFLPSDITGDCAVQVQEIVRERKSGKTSEKAISSALSCMKNGNGPEYLGLISTGMGYWTYSVSAYETALKYFEKLGIYMAPPGCMVTSDQCILIWASGIKQLSSIKKTWKYQRNLGMSTVKA